MDLPRSRQLARLFASITLFCIAVPAFSASQLANPASPQAGQTAVTSSRPEPSPTSQVVPKDARELLLAAAQVNGLDAPGLKPWHILVSYDKFDEDGDNVDSGTYEEFWLGTNQYRIAYTSHDFTQTEIATEKGLYRSGDDKWPGALQIRVRDEFVRPMFREMNLQYAKLEKIERSFGKAQLPCVMFRGTDGNMIVSDNGLAAFCFEPDTLMLRYSKGGMALGTVWDQIVYDRIVRFQGRYVARDVQVTRAGKPYLKLHLEKLESITQPDPANFTPPLTALAVDEKLISPDSAVLMLDYLIHEELPKYPKSIRPPGGEAVMKYRINKDGHVTAVQFVEGTTEMQKGLEESLKKFVYRPFLLRGEPVEIEVKQKFIYEVH